MMCTSPPFVNRPRPQIATVVVIESLTDSTTPLTVMFLARLVSVFCVGPITGVFVDRVDKVATKKYFVMRRVGFLISDDEGRFY